MTSIQQAPSVDRTRRNIIGAIVVAVAAVLLGTLLFTRLFGSGAGELYVQQLARMKPDRSFAPRLSIPTTYRGCTPSAVQGDETVPRDECGPSDEDSPDLGELAAAGDSPDPDTLHASALAAVIWQDEKNPGALDDAILRLERALRLSTHRVPLLVDLSAAHLVRAQTTQNPRDVLASLDYALEALEGEPRNVSARFNAALAMQAYGLDEEAAGAWDAYLALDPRSPWADEVRRRKQSLVTSAAPIAYPVPGAPGSDVAAFARRFPQEAREYGMENVLEEWGQAVVKADSPRAAALLHLAEDLGRALQQRRGGDASLADVVGAIRTAQDDAAATMALARAHRDYAVAKAYFGTIQTDSTKEALARVARTAPPSPVLLQWTAMIRAGTRPRAQAIADLRALIPQVDRSRHPALAGRVQLMLGTLLFRVGDYAVAREPLRGAADHLRNVGEIESYGAALSMEGETAYEVGDTVGASRLFHQAQWALRSYRSSDRLHNHLHGLARCAVLSRMPHAALTIYHEALRVTRREGTPARILDVLQARARARSILGDTAGAERDLDSAVALVARLPNDDVQEKWAQAVLKVANLREVPAAQMDTAVESFADYAIWLVPALLRRADALLTEGDLAGATLDLETVTNGVHGLSRRQANRALRGAVLEQARGRFDRLVMLYLHAGRNEDALRALERGRLSFAPWDSVAPVQERPAAPPGHVALEYALIGDTLVTFTIRGTHVEVTRQRVNRDAFRLAVEQVGAALESPGREAGAQAGLQRLYDWLIRPVRDSLGRPGTPLVILADGEVAGVPFAALRDSARGRYLAHDHPLRFANTLADAARAAPLRPLSGPALLVADPEFDTGRHPTLFPLDSARAEVNALRPLYPNAVSLVGDTATRTAFVANLQQASVVHYAGHAVFDDTRPERSYMVLAGADTTGRLTAEALGAMRLPGVRLVVLSACRTLRSRQGRSGGFAGFSGALLTAGAGGVVGSLWQVNDELTGPLMEVFHREYLRSRDPADALWKAQRAMLDSGDARLISPATWAGFRYTGARRP